MHKQKPVIREVHIGELDEVSSLLKDAYLQYKSSIPPERWENYLEDIIDVRSRLEESELIVAEMDNRMVGCITLYLDAGRSMPGAWPPGYAVIRLLAVHPEYRGRCIGHALMDECILRCRRAKVKAIGLHTTELMKVAREMYERMGFVRFPESDFHPAPGITVMAYHLLL